MDMAIADATKESLLKSNETFRNLVSKHKSYEQRLEELAALHFPNEDEQVEEVSLKKKKLLIKDEIYSMINDYAQGH